MSSTRFAPTAADTFDFRVVLHKLRRRSKLALTVTVVIFALMTALILSLTPLYYAESTVMINEREAKVVAFQQVLSAMPGDLEAVQSEAQVLESRELAGKVVDALHLSDRPEFNPRLDDGKIFTRAKLWVYGQINTLFDIPKESAAPELVRLRAIDILEKKLVIQPIGRSRAISISVRTQDAQLTADIVNTLVDIYINAQIETKLRLTHKANDFLATQAAEMRDQVHQADEAVAAYRTKAGLLETGKDALLVAQEIADASRQLADVQIKRSEAESRAREADDIKLRDALPEVLSSLLITHLKEQESQLKAAAIQAEASFGPQNAKAVQLRLSVADVNTRVSQEINRIAESLRTEAAVQRLREAFLAAKVGWLKDELGQSYKAEVQMHALQREADVGRGLLETMLTRQQEVSVGEVLQQADASILSRAGVPLKPSFPQTPLFLSVAGIVAVGLGCAAGIMMDGGGTGLKSMDEITPALSVRPLGLVPQIPRNVSASGYVLDRPQSAFAESLRAILVTVLPPGSGPRVLLVASALQDEGKSSTAISLARLAANMGLRTLVVDADLRRPSLHRMVGCPNRTGLSDVLDNRASATAVVQKDPKTPLSVVTAGTAAVDTLRLLASSAMQQAMDGWRTTFDLVIVDSPPTASVADARVIARCCDEAIFVVHWNRTRRGLVGGEIERMRETGIHIAGLVLTHVNVRQHAADTYSDSGAFFSYGNDYHRG